MLFGQMDFGLIGPAITVLLVGGGGAISWGMMKTDLKNMRSKIDEFDKRLQTAERDFKETRELLIELRTDVKWLRHKEEQRHKEEK